MTDWTSVLRHCGVDEETVPTWAPLFERYVRVEAFSYGAREVPDFTGQVLHETGLLEHLEENLNYSAARLMVVWPGRFPTMGAALPYANSPEALANRVYGGRMGNNQMGDGWRFRGSGCIMLTGRENYALIDRISGVPILDKPDLLRTPEPALRSAIAWWEAKVKDNAIGSVEKVTRFVNGGEQGLIDRRRLTSLAREALL